MLSSCSIVIANVKKLLNNNNNKKTQSLAFFLHPPSRNVGKERLQGKSERKEIKRGKDEEKVRRTKDGLERAKVKRDEQRSRAGEG